MRTFRLNDRPYQVPETWAELTPEQFFAAAPHLAEESLAARLRVLKAWCPKVPRKMWRGLTDDQLWDVATLTAWAWRKELDTQGVSEFTHRGTTYQLPEPRLLDAVVVEYAMATVYFHQFAHPQKPRPAALDQLVASLCRPLRENLAEWERNPLWDGQRRERYNAKLAEARALELADAPLGVKIVVLHHYLAAHRFVHQAYHELFKKVVVPEQPAHAKPAKPLSDGTELLELLADVAERGTYGTYEQVAHTSLHTIFFNLARQARRRRAAEKEEQ